jgi:hypothetical protein
MVYISDYRIIKLKIIAEEYETKFFAVLEKKGGHVEKSKSLSLIYVSFFNFDIGLRSGSYC